MKSKWQLLFFMGLVLLLVASISGCKPYTQADLDVAREVSYKEGYDAGKIEGEASGYSIGKAEGYKEGEGAGRTAGYKEGEKVGNTVGYQEGEEAGKAAGYQEGEKVGYIKGKNDGFKEGEIAGYNQGYSAGMEAGLGHGYTLKDPTYSEAVAFLREDTTDSNEYNENTYNCSHFCRDVVNNAEQQRLRAAIVLIQFPRSISSAGHSVIAFNTIDRGIVYFEPQFDDEIELIIGESFTMLNNYRQLPSVDDTIAEIIAIW
jgi:hypothetical protein